MIKVFLPIWGEKASQNFCSFHKSGLISALEKLPDNEEINIFVVSDYLAQNILSNFSWNSRRININYIKLPSVNKKNNYALLVHATKIFTKSIEFGDLVFIITADMIFSNDSLLNCYTKLQSYNLVLSPCFRITEEKYNHSALSLERDNFTSECLLRHLLQNEHPITTSMRMDNDYTYSAPSMILERDEKGYKGFCYVMHPLGFYYSKKISRSHLWLTFDHCLGLSQVDKSDQIYVCTSLEDGLILSSSPKDYKQYFKFNLRDKDIKSQIQKILNWLNNGWALNFHLWQSQFNISYLLPTRHSNVMRKNSDYIYSRISSYILDKYMVGKIKTQKELLTPFNLWNNKLIKIKYQIKELFGL